MKTNKLLIFLFALVFLISSISAITIYPGETLNLNYSTDFDNITNSYIELNTTAINFIVYENYMLNVTIPGDYDSGTFRIILEGFKEEEEVIVKTNVGSGGGGSGFCPEKTWKCENITECINGVIEVKCKSNCNKIKISSESCGINLNNSNQTNQNNQTSNNSQTGEEQDYNKPTFDNSYVKLILAIVIISTISLLYFKFNKKSKLKKTKIQEVKK